MNDTELMDVIDYANMIKNGSLDATTLSYNPNSITSSTTISTAAQALSGAITSHLNNQDDNLLDEFEMNRFAVDHKVTEAELLKLKEVAPDYATEIKDNIARNLARDITKKIAFKKKHDTDTDVHHFIGRVWVFTDEEMKEIVRRIK